MSLILAMTKLFIFSNESISIDENKYYCDNLDLKSTPEGLNKNFEVNLIARASKEKRSHKINIKEIKIFRTFISFLFSVINSINNNKEAKFLIDIILEKRIFILQY